MSEPTYRVRKPRIRRGPTGPAPRFRRHTHTSLLLKPTEMTPQETALFFAWLDEAKPRVMAWFERDRERKRRLAMKLRH